MKAKDEETEELDEVQGVGRGELFSLPRLFCFGTPMKSSSSASTTPSSPALPRYFC